MPSVSISKGNIKMGAISSVSLPSIVTCRNCKCIDKCYANKIERLRPSVRNAYARNLTILREDPTTYWREVEAAIMTSRFFRFHVSGDIPNPEYLSKMLEIASRNQHCEILCFTKRYEYVNDAIEAGAEIPKNLHLIFSGWPGLEMKNPHRLPEAHVMFRTGITTARADATPCGGNCTECACTDSGCWALRPGEQIVFNEH